MRTLLRNFPDRTRFAALCSLVGLLTMTIGLIAPVQGQPGSDPAEDSAVPGDTESAGVDAAGADSAPEWVASVRHRTPEIRPEEQGALRTVVQQVRELDFAEQQDRARKNIESRIAELPGRDRPGFVFDIHRDMLTYTTDEVDGEERVFSRWDGRLVTIRGELRNLSEQSPEQTGLEEPVWRGLLYTAQSPSAPFVVYATRIPEDLPRDQEVVERVTATGYFFKLADLDDEGTRRLAPMIISQRLQWAPPGAAGSPQLSDELLVELKDHIRDFREITPEESASYYAILRYARETDPAQQRAAAAELLQKRREEITSDVFRQDPDRPYPIYVDMLNNPERFRGRLVTLEGYVRRLLLIGENEHGLDNLYEAWLYTDDSQGHPAVVVFSAKPEEMPEGNDISEHVRITGYFFKLWRYEAQDNDRFTPMILAHRIQWFPDESITRTPSLLLYVALAVIMVIVGLGIWRVARQPIGHRVPAEAEQEALGEPDFSALEGESAAADQSPFTTPGDAEHSPDDPPVEDSDDPDRSDRPGS